MIHKSDDLVSGIFRSSPSEVVKKILVRNIFSNYKKMYLVKFAASELDGLFKKKKKAHRNISNQKKDPINIK